SPSPGGRLVVLWSQPVAEPVGCGAQRQLRVDAHPPRQVDEGEQRLAEPALGRRPRRRGINAGCFLSFAFGSSRVYPGPLEVAEPGGGRSALDLARVEQR